MRDTCQENLTSGIEPGQATEVADFSVTSPCDLGGPVVIAREFDFSACRSVGE
jgi:hypothetical protein